MTQALLLLVKLAILFGVALYFADNPGSVEITWKGMLVETNVGTLLVILLALVFLALGAYRLYSSAKLAASRAAHSRERKGREIGMQALTQGLTAVAAGDLETAQRSARVPELRYVSADLAALLQAEAAQLAGDEAGARAGFTKLIKGPETALLGLRGLIQQDLRRGNYDEALKLARKARDLQPRNKWVLTTLFGLELRRGDLEAAEAVLNEAVKAKAVPEGIGRRHHAALLVERSRRAEADGNLAAAVAFAERAHGVDPTSAPSAAQAAHLAYRTDKAKHGDKIIQQTWKHQGHPDLVRAWLAPSLAADPEARLKRLEGLVGQGKDDAEARLAAAEAATELRQYGEARRLLGPILSGRADRRAFRLMARVEEAETGDAAAVRRHLDGAAHARPEPVWSCDECHTQFTEWQVICPSCGAFDNMVWDRAGRYEDARESVLQDSTGGAGIVIPAAATPATPAPPALAKA